MTIRAIIEEMGGSIELNGSERKVTIKLKNTTIELWIDKTIAIVNVASKEFDVPPMIINGRTMLPLRFISENLGCDVDWNGTTKTIKITCKLEELPKQDIDKIIDEKEKVIGSA